MSSNMILLDYRIGTLRYRERSHMSEKRRDKRNRLLRNGESQRKDGRYVYKYVDLDGKNRYVYSWKLEKNDRVPAGKTKGLSLREKEKQIQQDMFDQIVPQGGNLTVLELVEKYMSLKVALRPTTLAHHRYLYRVLQKQEFGKQRIDKVKLSDAKAWLIKMQKSGIGFSTIRSLRGVVKPAFEMAVKDDLLRKNPFDFELASVVVNTSVTREAITRSQERTFLKFIQNDEHFCKYYDAIYILFNTGMRISEFCGLTLSDLDFKNKQIRVERQLRKDTGVGFYISTTKTKKGQRYIPMSPQVEECFKRIISERPQLKSEMMIDGKTGFLFYDKNGKPLYSLHWEKYFQHIVQKHNSIYKLQLPKITPHVCRHTFCSKMAKSGMNPKTLQYIMGHSDISVTLNTYTHFTTGDIKEEYDRVIQGQEDVRVANVVW